MLPPQIIIMCKAHTRSFVKQYQIWGERKKMLPSLQLGEPLPSRASQSTRLLHSTEVPS